MLNKGMFTSNTDLWATPQAFFDELNKEFNFTLDVCATTENAKCENFFIAEQDGLKQNWSTNGSIWCNPPYGRENGKDYINSITSPHHFKSVQKCLDCIRKLKTIDSSPTIKYRVVPVIFLKKEVKFD